MQTYIDDWNRQIIKNTDEIKELENQLQNAKYQYKLKLEELSVFEQQHKEMIESIQKDIKDLEQRLENLR